MSSRKPVAGRLVPDAVDVRSNSVGIVGWDEGSSGQIHSWIGEAGYHVACFVNAASAPPQIDIAKEREARDARRFDFPTRDSFKGLPLVTAPDWPDVLRDLGIRRALVTLSDPRQRFENIGLARTAKLELINAIHSTVTILADASIEDNVVLYPRAFVGYRAEIQTGAMINTGAQLDHQNVVGACATVSPGVITAGNVTIGRFATVHTGAIIKNRVRIGDGAIVGAGSVIIEDVPPDVTVVGVPGRIVKVKRH